MNKILALLWLSFLLFGQTALASQSSEYLKLVSKEAEVKQTDVEYFLNYKGVVQNVSTRPITNVYIEFVWFDEANRPIATEKHFVASILYPGGVQEYQFSKNVKTLNKIIGSNYQFFGQPQN